MSLKSDTQLAAEYCMNAAGQRVRQRPATPPDDERLLRAKLIMEEAIETVNALGCVLLDFTDRRISSLGQDLYIEYRPDHHFNLIEAIDGCCDLNVVVAGTMSCIGVPDKPFQEAVNLANVAKFPGGVVTPHPTIPGKYGKPEGWLPPNHVEVLARLAMDDLDGEQVL